MPVKRILLVGACGKMGLEIVRTVFSREDIILAGVVDLEEFSGKDIGEMALGRSIGLQVFSSLENTIEESHPDVVVDFTNGASAGKNIKISIDKGIPVISGTTGIPSDDIREIEKLSIVKKVPVLIAPNFSLGAVLMMVFSRMASKYFSYSEIIELHHEKKTDSPSGTAMRTAELMLQVRDRFYESSKQEEKIPHCRGGERGGIHIHSVRIKGLLAHQEVIFGGEGETLTIRHDSISRTSFMPGVVLAIQKIDQLSGLTIGLENLIWKDENFK